LIAASEGQIACFCYVYSLLKSQKPCDISYIYSYISIIVELKRLEK